MVSNSRFNIFFRKSDLRSKNIDPFEISAWHPICERRSIRLAANAVTASLYLSDGGWRKQTAASQAAARLLVQRRPQSRKTA